MKQLWVKYLQWETARRRDLALVNIRRSMAALGHDVSELSDDEIERAMKDFASHMKTLGFSCDTAAAAMRELGRVAMLAESKK